MRLLSAFCVVIVTLTSASARTQDRVDAEYGQIVERYRSEPNEAARRLMAMPPADLDRAIHDALAPGSRWTTHSLDAAMLMHTDAAVFLAGEHHPGAWLHLRIAQDLGSAAARDAENTWFVHQWYGAVTQAFSRDARVNLIRKRWHEQPWRENALALVRGLFQERLGAFAPANPVPLLDSEVYNPLQFRSAHIYYERALSGGLLVAAVHMGRLEMVRGKDAEARVLFTTAAERSKSPTTRYLAHLFLGTMDERDGDQDAAQRHYDAALRAFPHGQSGRLALAALLARGGETAASARLAADRAPNESRLPLLDPW